MKRKRKQKEAEAFNAPKVFRFVGNVATKEVHLAAWAGGDCQLDEIRVKREFATFEESLVENYNGCGHCCRRFAQGDILEEE